jgi:uncharacterized membrane protein (UPF0182 family)
VRVPEDLPTPGRVGHRAGSVVLVVVVLLVLVGLLAHRAAESYTEDLWFAAVGQGAVWRRTLETQLVLFGVFGGLFGLATAIALGALVRHAPSEAALGGNPPRGVRAARAWALGHPWALPIVCGLLGGLLAGWSAAGQWQAFLLWRDGTGLPAREAQFHLPVGFFVYRLPFLSFVADWVLASSVILGVLSALVAVATGGIALGRGVRAPRSTPAVRAELSVLLVVAALAKGAGYWLARYRLALSSDGPLHGVGYTDVHARIPALTLLALICGGIALVALWNLWQRTWRLPVVALGVWVIGALGAGALYPAILQALKVDPNPLAAERPYVAREVAATRAAYGLGSVEQATLPAGSGVSQAELDQAMASLRDAWLWDPAETAGAFRSRAAPGTTVVGLSLEPGSSGGGAPVVVGADEADDATVKHAGWAATHLRDTHGDGLVEAPATEAGSAGQPLLETDPKALHLADPTVNVGVAVPGAQASYVVVPATQANGGGVALGSFLTKAAFSLRFGDLDLLLSNGVTARSRLLLHRDVAAAAHLVAPFLTLDGSPYPVVVDGHVDWVQDADTTSANYPGAAPVGSSLLPPGTGLQPASDFVRPAAVVVTNAVTGTVRLYDLAPHNPLLASWRRAYPGLFLPARALPAAVRSRLVYPPGALLVQAEMEGIYRLGTASAVLEGQGTWTVAPDPGAGPPSSGSQPVEVRDGFGLLVPTGQLEPMLPLPEVVQLPGQRRPSFQQLEPLVPVSTGGVQGETLAGLLAAESGPSAFADGPGALRLIGLPRGAQLDAPALAAAQARSASAVTRTIGQLDRDGATVLLGRLESVPLGPDVVYLRALYLQPAHSSTQSFQAVLTVLAEPTGGQRVGIASTLDDALAQVLPGLQVPGATQSTPKPRTQQAHPAPSSHSTTQTAEIQHLVAEALADEQAAQQDLRNGNFTGYGQEQSALEAVLQQLAALTATPSSSSSTSQASSASSASSQPSSQGTTAGASTSQASATSSEPNSSGSTKSSAAAPDSGTTTSPAASAAASSGTSGQTADSTPGTGSSGARSGLFQPQPGEAASLVGRGRPELLE